MSMLGFCWDWCESGRVFDSDRCGGWYGGAGRGFQHLTRIRRRYGGAALRVCFAATDACGGCGCAGGNSTTVQVRRLG